MPGYDESDFDVLAFELPHEVDLPIVKEALISRLAETGDHPGETSADGLRDLTDPMARAGHAPPATEAVTVIPG